MYKGPLSVYGDLMGFLREIEPEITHEMKDQLVCDIKAKEGFPLFSREDLPLDLKAASTLFYRLLKYLASRNRRDKGALEEALTKAQTDPNWTRGVIRAFLSSDEMAIASIAEEANLEPVVLKFVTHMALRPSLNTLKESCSERVQRHGWDHGCCPLCGSSPDVAYFNEDGKRFLHCELCGYEWYYSRLRCPFCENNEPKELGYFVTEDEEGFRVDFCKKCNCYIKTLDKRVIVSLVPLELQNLVTLHLDMLAHEQGFKAPHG